MMRITTVSGKGFYSTPKTNFNRKVNVGMIPRGVYQLRYQMYNNNSSWGKHTLPDVLPLSILHEKYEKKEISVTEVMEEVMHRVNNDKASWIFKVPKQHILARAEALDDKLAKNNKTAEEFLQEYPLFGIPFSIKDNIDAEGVPTTAGCPEYAYTSWSSNPVVEKLIKAGAVLIGKNNMDQFAAGLVGIRSPYGTPENPFNKDYCPGGSSSGSGSAPPLPSLYYYYHCCYSF